MKRELAVKLFVLSCHCHIADLSKREKLAFTTKPQLVMAYRAWRQQYPGTEIVLLSTCNRVEVYVAANDEAAVGANEIIRFVSDFHGLTTGFVKDNTILREGSDVAEHVFRVTSSLDSIAIGETQIVAQVKSAYQASSDEQACGPTLHLLFQQALAVSAKVRTTTQLTKGRTSIASVAFGAFVNSVFPSLATKTVVVIGAGEMATETLHCLRSRGVGQMILVNRSIERGSKLAQTFGAHFAPLTQLAGLIRKADVIVSATSSTEILIDRAFIEGSISTNSEKPVVLLDLAAPRNIDRNVSNLPNVTLFNLDDLGDASRQTACTTSHDLCQAKAIVENSTAQFDREIQFRKSANAICSMRNQVNQIAQTELQTLFQKASLDFDDTQASEIENTVSRVLNKLLHTPFRQLKDETAAEDEGQLLASFIRLFELQA